MRLFESTRRQKESPLCYIDGHLSSQECGVRTKISEVLGSSRAPTRHCKDDCGSCVVFTEQSSSTSQMTAAKVMDIISRLPGCAGQAADAVSAHTQVKMEDAPKLLKIPKSECPDIWIRLPRHKWPKSWSSMEDPVVPLERNLYGHPLAGLLWERQFETILVKHGWEKIPNWECLFVHHEKGLFLSVYVDDIKLAAKVMDVVARLPDCDGQAADAISAYTQVKMDDTPSLLKIPKSECPDFWIRLPRHKWPTSCSSMEDPVGSSWAKSVRSSISRTIMGKAIRESSIKIQLGKGSRSGMLIR